MSNGPVEPSSDARQMAKAVRDVFLALLAEGFNEKQALIIIGQMMAAGQGGKR